MTLEEAANKLVIDKFNLDEESAHQDQFFWEVCNEYGNALERKDTAKHILKIREAEAAKYYRESTSEKVTEARVSEYVTLAPQCVEQQQFVIKYTAEVEKWDGMIESFKQRGYAIDKLVELHLSGYYGTGVSSPERRYIEARKAKEN